MLNDRGARICDNSIAGWRKYLKKYAKLIGVSEFLTPLLLARENI
jgi:hypothetical protein